MKLIGFTGPARCGKDTAADYLHSLIPGSVRMAFADPLRDTLQHMLDEFDIKFDRRHKEKPLVPFGKSPRNMLRTLGTEWGRNLVHPDIWLMIAQKKVQHLTLFSNTEKVFIFSDVRFENEAEWIREHGHLVHITRMGFELDPAAHQSECGVTRLDGIDFIMPNNGTLPELGMSVRMLLAMKGILPEIKT